MDTKVFLREENKFKEVTITSTTKPDLSDEFLEKWQKIINLVVEIIDIPAALIMRINEDTMEVLLSSENEESPYHSGDKESLGNGLYCETVIGKDQELEVDNALKYKKWEDNPDVELDMISYYGLPIKWNDNESFGTICVLDSKTKKLTEIQKEFLENFRDVIEDDLKLLVSQQKMKEQNKLFKKLLNNSLEGILLMDEDFNILKANQEFEKIFGYKSEALINNNIVDCIVPDDEYEDFLKYKNQVLNNKDVETVVKRKTKDGDIKLISLNLIPIEVANNEINIYGVYNDITAKRKREIEIKEIKERLSLAIEGANIGIWDWNIKTGEVHYNQNWANMLGYSLDELENSIKTWEKLVYEEDEKNIEKDLNEHLYGNSNIYENEHRLRTKEGKLKWVRDVGRVIKRDKDGNPLRVVGVHIDINDRKEYEEKIKFLSYRDELTGLYNRRFLNNEMDRLSNSRKYPIALIVGDLDKLKEVNDQFGHSMGDYYIKKSAEILKNSLRNEDIIARTGGDEFTVLLPETTKKRAKEIVKRIKENFKNVNREEDLPEELSISLGIETAEDDNIKLKNVFEKADHKMYINKGRR